MENSKNGGETLILFDLHERGRRIPHRRGGGEQRFTGRKKGWGVRACSLPSKQKPWKGNHYGNRSMGREGDRDNYPWEAPGGKKECVLRLRKVSREKKKFLLHVGSNRKSTCQRKGERGRGGGDRCFRTKPWGGMALKRRGILLHLEGVGTLSRT